MNQVEFNRPSDLHMVMSLVLKYITAIYRFSRLVVKTPPAKAGDLRDTGLIPGSGKCPGEGHGNLSSLLAWRIPWTEEPGGPQSIGQTRLTRMSMAYRFDNW